MAFLEKKARPYKGVTSKKKKKKKNILGSLKGIEEAQGNAGKTALAVGSTVLGTYVGFLLGSLIKKGSFLASLPVMAVGLYTGKHLVTSAGAGMMVGGAVKPSEDKMKQIKEETENPEAKWLNVPREKAIAGSTINIHLNHLKQEFFLNSFNKNTTDKTEESPTIQENKKPNTEIPESFDKEKGSEVPTPPNPQETKTSIDSETITGLGLLESIL